MKGPLITPVILACLLAIGTGKAEPLPVVAPETVGLSADKLGKIDEKVTQLIEEKKLAGCVVAVARRGQIAYLKAFGVRNKATGEPMEEDTIFRIYSMSKSIATAAALALVDEGKLELDAPVAKYLPELAKVRVFTAEGEPPVQPKRAMTVRDLMRHTSGLTYGFFGDTEVDKAYRKANVLVGTLEELPQKLGELPLLDHPGERWVYSVASDVLGRLVEVASEHSFESFLEKRFFEPLQMRDTGFHVPRDKVSRFAANHGPELVIADHPEKSRFLKPPAMASGGGGLVSTTRDYLRFLQMIAQGGTFEGKRYLKKETVALMTSNQLPESIPCIGISDKRPGVGFGLGFSVRIGNSGWDSAAPIGEYGWGGAASTHYWVSPKDELIVVTMEQTVPFNFNLEFGLKKVIYDAIID